jgi:peptide/nickel transport system permease protein
MSATPVPMDPLPAAPAGQATSSPRFLRRLLRRPIAVVCLAYLAAIVIVAVVAPLVWPGVSTQQAGDLFAARQGPSSAHLLGTDGVGRDVLQRLLVGTRVTMIAVAEALVVFLALGVPLGLVAGFFGGVVDRVVSWVADLTFSVPALIIVLVVLSVFPQSSLAAMIALGVLASPFLMRIVRSATLPIREELYVAAARVSGLSRRYIVSRHVLPRISGPIIVQAALFAGGALLVQTGLAFLNLLVAPPAPSWGGMFADGLTNISLQPWLIWPPGVMIALTILAFGLLGDAVRDATTETWQAPVRRRARGGSRRRRAASATQRPVPGERALPDGDAPAAAGRPLLALEGVSVAFPASEGAVTVVDDVTFDVRAGETVGIVGESGCGKTMTAMSILGLLPGNGRVSAGRILFDGRDLARATERELRGLRGKQIGLISQEPMVGMNPAFRVGWQLADCVRLHHGVSRREASRRALELLARVQLPDPEAVARRYPHELSGGMAQRVSIARALSGEPRLLIADEPTTALDVTVQLEILRLLRDLQEERGMAILLVTHDWGVIADICKRAVVMYAGQVVERAGIASIFREPLHPYTRALLASNPHVQPEAESLPSIPGAVPKPGGWPQGCHFHPRCSHATPACRARAIPLERVGDERETRCIHYEELMAS